MYNTDTEATYVSYIHVNTDTEATYVSYIHV